MEIEVINNELIVDNKKIEFEYSIDSYLVYKSIIIVLLHIPNDMDEINNIYGVNGDTSEIIWRVEDIRQYVGQPTPYHTISFSNNNLFAFTWDGGRFIIKQENGKIIYKDFSR